MENKKIKPVEFLDSIDERKNKIFNIAYLCLMFWLILSPLTTTLLAAIGSPVEMVTQCVMIGIFFGVVWLIDFSMKITKLRFKKLTAFEYIGAALALLFLFQIFFNKVYGFAGVLFYLSYFLIFCLAFKVDKKYYKLLLYVFIIELSIDSILGIIDYKNEIIPGFDEGYAYSLQFNNPNYSACVVLGAIIVSIYYFINESKISDKIITGICFIILNIFLFINGCFAVEFALFAAELVLFVFYWIKNKKFPLWVFIAFLVTFIASFFRNNGYSSSNTVFIFELLGRIDVKFGTNFMDIALDIVDKFSQNSKKHFIGDVSGTNKKQNLILALKEDSSDYYSRPQVMKRALETIYSSAGAFFFGKGSGFADAMPHMRVHNIFVLLWLEFGFVFMLAFIALFICLFVMFIKSKNKSRHIIYLTMVFAYLLSYYFGMMDFSFPFFLMLLAILYKNLKDDLKECKDKKED